MYLAKPNKIPHSRSLSHFPQHKATRSSRVTNDLSVHGITVNFTTNRKYFLHSLLNYLVFCHHAKLKQITSFDHPVQAVIDGIDQDYIFINLCLFLFSLWQRGYLYRCHHVQPKSHFVYQFICFFFSA